MENLDHLDSGERAFVEALNRARELLPDDCFIGISRGGDRVEVLRWGDETDPAEAESVHGLERWAHMIVVLDR